MIEQHEEKIAIFSDLHIGIHNNSSEWHTIAIDWVGWFKGKLIEHNIKTLFFLGDFFHDRASIDVSTLSVGLHIMKELSMFKIIMIPGNHDCYFKDNCSVHSLSMFKHCHNVKIYDNEIGYEEFGGKVIALYPWGCNTIVSSDISMGHFEVETFKVTYAHTCEKGLKIQDLIDKSPLTLSGHFHLKDTREYTNTQKSKSKIVYVGNTFQMNFGDAGDTKGFHILDKNSSLTFISNDTSPRYFRLNLNNIIKNDNLEPLKHILKGNFIKIVVDKNISNESLSILTHAINKYSPRVVQIDYDINFGINLSSNEKLDLGGIEIEQAIKEFVNLLDINNKSEVTNQTINLYKGSLNEEY